MQEDVRKCKEDITRKKAAIQAKNDELANFKTMENTTLIGVKNELTSLQKDYEALKKEKAALDAGKTKHESEINDVKKKEGENTKKINELRTKCDEEMKKLNEKIKEKNNQIKAIEEKSKKSLELKEAQLKKLDEERSTLNTKNDLLSSSLEQLKVDLQNSETQIKNLNTEMVTIKQILETTTRNLQELEGKNKNLEADKNKYNTNIESLQARFDAMETERNNYRTTVDQLTSKIANFKEQKAPFFEIHNNSDKPPRLEYSNGFISVFRGWYNDKKLIPKFDSVNIISALGFVSDPSVLLKTEPKVTAWKPADFNTHSSLLFVHSDIVAPHYVGSTRSRVLRICPLRKGKAFEMVHEKFTNPLYYRLRTNKIEDVSFTLRDENGKIVNFAPGRVLIGIHLKRSL